LSFNACINDELIENFRLATTPKKQRLTTLSASKIVDDSIGPVAFEARNGSFDVSI
jgi:hypothetical protein